ncbi:MAG: hypothetical protein ABI296_08670 [Gammaproteobacteria bacterium]
MKNFSAKSTPLDMDKWREIIEAWNKSGESQKAYCDRLEISFNTFTYARTKFLQQDNPKTQFIPLTVKSNSEEKLLPLSSITLENPYGYKLHLPASLSLEQLTKLFKLSGWNDA